MTMKSPDLNLLPIAFALYNELSVSRAARLLGMSQPAVSMALRRHARSVRRPAVHPRADRHHADAARARDCSPGAATG